MTCTMTTSTRTSSLAYSVVLCLMCSTCTLAALTDQRTVQHGHSGWTALAPRLKRTVSVQPTLPYDLHTAKHWPLGPLARKTHWKLPWVISRAGGQIAMGTLQRMNDDPSIEESPGGGFLLSPVTDFALESDSWTRNGPYEFEHHLCFHCTGPAPARFL